MGWPSTLGLGLGAISFALLAIRGELRGIRRSLEKIGEKLNGEEG